MATVTFTYPDELVADTVAAFCHQYGYKPTVPDPQHPGQMMPNPIDPGTFARNCIITFSKEVLKAYKVNQATEQARAAAMAEVQQTVDNAAITSEIGNQPT